MSELKNKPICKEIKKLAESNDSRYFYKFISNLFFVSASRKVKVFEALHHLLPPCFCKTEITDGGESLFSAKNKPGESEYQRTKFSIIYSVMSTLVIVEHGELFKDRVQQLANEARKKKIHCHPIMGVVKNSFGEFEKFLLFFNNIQIQCESFLQCFEVYLKVFYVFNFKYPVEALAFCSFCAEYFFNLKNKDDFSGKNKVRILLSKFKK